MTVDGQARGGSGATDQQRGGRLPDAAASNLYCFVLGKSVDYAHTSRTSKRVLTTLLLSTTFFLFVPAKNIDHGCGLHGAPQNAIFERTAFRKAKKQMGRTYFTAKADKNI